MNVLSLFSGIGGLDLGLQRAGMTIVGQVEIDPWCRRVLAKHWPEVPRHDDVRTCVEWWLGHVADAECPGLAQREGQPGDYEAELPPVERGRGDRTAGTGGRRPRVDLVCGGFPCQPVSLAGKGLAQADSRWLWPAFAGVIRHLRPAYVLVENVPGLLGRGMGDVLGDLAALGYDAEWDCVPAAFVGAPHIRNRVWIVAYPGNGTEPERPRETGWQAGEWPSVRHVAGNDGQNVANADDGQHDQRPGEVRAADQRLVARRRSLGTGRSGADVPDAAGDRQSAEGQRAAAGHADGSDHLRPERQADHAADTDRKPLGWPSAPRCERGHWATEPDVGRVAHGIPARLDRLRGLGNAVVPQVAEHVGRLIMEAAS